MDLQDAEIRAALNETETTMRVRKLANSSLLTFAVIAPFVLPSGQAKADTPSTIMCSGWGPGDGSYTPPHSVDDCAPNQCPAGFTVFVGNPPSPSDATACTNIPIYDSEGNPVAQSGNYTCPCVAVPPPPPPNHDEFSDPTYMVFTILYMPPGLGSSSIYTKGNQVGSRTEIKSGKQMGLALHIGSNTTSDDFTTSAGSEDGTSAEVKASSDWGNSLTSPSDTLNHWNDTYLLWTNPEIVSSVDSNQQISSNTVRSTNGQAMHITKVTLGQLAGFDPITAIQKAELSALTLHDRYVLMTMDPWFGFFVGPDWSPRLDPNRFVKLPQHFQVDNTLIDHGLFSQSVDMSNENTSGIIAGWLTNASATLQVGGEVDFLVKGSVMAGITYSYSYERATDNYTTDVAGGTATIQSTTPCFHVGVDLYYDSLVGTFAYVTTDGGKVDCTDTNWNVQGNTTDDSGAPKGHRQVKAKLANGQVWYTTSDSNGRYRFQYVYSPVVQITASEASIVVTRGGPLQTTIPKPGFGVPNWVTPGPIVSSEIMQQRPTEVQPLSSLAHRTFGPWKVLQ